MPPERKGSSQTHNLTRVRNNQRRSRARKREYVAELERKLKECEVNGPPLKEIVSKDIARRLEEENRKLRELLARVGLDQTLVNAHLSKSQSQEKYDSTLDAPNVVLGTATIKKDCRCGPSKFSNSAGEKENPQRDKDRLQLPNREQVTARAVGLESNGIVGVDSIPSGEETNSRVMESPPLPPPAPTATAVQLSENDFDFDFNFDLDLDPSLGLFDTSKSSIALPFEDSCIPRDLTSITSKFPNNPSPSNFVLPPPSSELSCDQFLCPDQASLPTAASSDCGSTLCSVAYDMVRQHNKRGIDMVEIGIRLWNGFIKGEGSSGCKVDNKLLFSVLEYISA